MFPLTTRRAPADARELRTAIDDALRAMLRLRPDAPAVTVDAPYHPVIDTLGIDLDGASLHASEMPHKPRRSAGGGSERPPITVNRLEVSCRPIRLLDASLDLSVAASGVQLSVVEDSAEKHCLMLSALREARVQMSIDRAQLDLLATAVARLAAKARGIEVEGVTVELADRGPRCVAATVCVRARKMLLTGTIRAHAMLSVDQHLRVTARDLACSGQGVIGAMAAAVLQPKLKACQDRPILLISFGQDAVLLADLQIDLRHGLHVIARLEGGGTAESSDRQPMSAPAAT